MLADVMLYALKHHKPSLMVDVTCLSDSVRHVFGAGASGCWANSKAMWTHIKKAGAYTGKNSKQFFSSPTLIGALFVNSNQF